MLQPFLTAMVLAAVTAIASAEPVVTAVLNGASYSAAVAPNCWIAIFGFDLAPGVQTASGSLTTTVAGVSVLVGTSPAQLSYVSPSQINALIPADVEVPANAVVPLVVTTGNSKSKVFNLRLSRNAPGIFTRNGAGTGRALFFDVVFNNLEALSGDETAIIYATGLGPIDSRPRGCYIHRVRFHRESTSCWRRFLKVNRTALELSELHRLPRVLDFPWPEYCPRVGDEPLVAAGHPSAPAASILDRDEPECCRPNLRHSDGRHFVVDTSANSDLSHFGGICSGANRTVSAAYVEDEAVRRWPLLASKDVPNRVTYRYLSPE